MMVLLSMVLFWMEALVRVLCSMWLVLIVVSCVVMLYAKESVMVLFDMVLSLSVLSEIVPWDMVVFCSVLL